MNWDEAIRLRKKAIELVGINRWRDAAETIANERHLSGEYTLSAWWLAHATIEDEIEVIKLLKIKHIEMKPIK